MEDPAQHNSDEIRWLIENEKKEVNALKKSLEKLRTTFHTEADELKKQLADQHDMLAGIIHYARNLEAHLTDLRKKVDTMKNLHRHSIH